MQSEPKKRKRLRIISVLVFFYLGFGIVAFRSYQLQVLQAERLRSLARGQYLKKYPLRYPRGIIYDRNLQELAVSRKGYSIFAYTRKINNPHLTAMRLSRILDKSSYEIENKLRDKEPFVWIARQVSEEQGEAVLALGLSGIGAQADEGRYYPGGEIAGQVLGFAGVDGQGLEGVERFYDEYLRGKPIFITVEKDAHHEIRMFVDEPDDSAKTASLVLTIDQALQHLSEQKLKEAVTKWNARRGCVIAMDPETGEILAMAFYPGFNPNYFYRYDFKDWRNWAVTDIYEPGSTFKVFVLASALEEDKVKPEDIIDCENGSYVVTGDTIHDLRNYQKLSVLEVLAYSSNIGMAKIAEKIGPALLYEYLLNFGFGQKTGIDFLGEGTGLVRHYKKWPAITLRTIAFGQGVSVTPIQMVSALSAIANGGELVKPYIAEKVIYPDGSERILHRRTLIRRVISESTARRLTDLMTEVVKIGTGTQAQISGYEVAGKTGTAQKVRPREYGGGYEPDRWVCSFMGFAPADKPRIAVLVIIDEPKADRATGGMIAAPVFQEVVRYALSILGELPELGSSGIKTSFLDSIINNKYMGLDDSGNNAVLESGKVPDFKGMSLLDALKLALEMGQKPIIKGSGWVIAQEPASGSELSGRIILMMSQERR